MNNSMKILSLLVAVAVVAGVSMHAIGQGGGAKQPTRVAVVDIKAAFDSLHEKAKIEADFQARATQIKIEQDRRQKEIDALRGDIEVIPTGTPDHDRKMEELQKAGINAQAWIQFTTTKLNRDRVRATEGLYKKLLGEIEKVAKAEGYDVVLFKEQIPNFPPNVEPQQLAALIQVRKVLYASDDIDITSGVVQKMNREFNRN